VVVAGAGGPLSAGPGPSSGTKPFDGGRRGRPEPDGEHRDGGGLVSLRIYDLKNPVIAAINGPAVGFGITMTLPMDIRIASSAAQIGFFFARRGVVPEPCSTLFLPRLVRMQRAAEWVYTGRVFEAAEARAGGLVSPVEAPGGGAGGPPTTRAGPRGRDRRPHLGRVGRPRAADDVEAPGCG